MRASIAAARVNGPSRDSDGAATVEFRFAATNPLFAGHFPSQPLLPGVFQLEMARLGAEWLLGQDLSVREISRAKFLRPILPGQLIRMNLKVSEDEESVAVRASFLVGGQAAGETVLTLRKTDVP